MGDNNETISKSQMYYDGLLPGNIYRTRNRAFAMVLGAGNNEDEAREIDRDQLIDVTRKVLMEWENLSNARVDQTLLSALENPERFIEVASPDSIYVEPFPMMLQCSQCGLLDYHRGRRSNEDRVQRAARAIRNAGTRSYIPCRRSPACAGSMKQVRHISIHRCGKIEPITLPFNAMNLDSVGYQDKGGSFQQSRFIDVDTGLQISRPMQPNCRDCEALFPEMQGLTKRGIPVENAQKFYPHNIQYLCLKKETGEQVSRLSGVISPADSRMNDAARDIAEAVASCLIGLSKGADLASHIRDILGGEGPDREKMEAITLKLEKERKSRSEILAAMPANLSNSIPEFFPLDMEPMTAIRELSHDNEARASAPFAPGLVPPCVLPIPVAATPTLERYEKLPVLSGVARH